MFGKKTAKNLRDAHDQQILDVHTAIQELNKLVDQLPGRYYLTFSFGTKKARTVALMDDFFVPIGTQVQVAPEAIDPLKKIIHGLDQRDHQTIVFDSSTSEDGTVTLLESEGEKRRTVLTPMQIRSITMAVPIGAIINAYEMRGDEVEQYWLAEMPGRDELRERVRASTEPKPIIEGDAPVVVKRTLAEVHKSPPAKTGDQMTFGGLTPKTPRAKRTPK